MKILMMVIIGIIITAATMTVIMIMIELEWDSRRFACVSFSNIYVVNYHFHFTL